MNRFGTNPEAALRRAASFISAPGNDTLPIDQCLELISCGFDPRSIAEAEAITTAIKGTH